MLELVNATTTTDKGWFYTRPEVGSIGTIDVPLILKQKTLLIASSRVPTGLTLFAQCIHALKKRKKTKREAPSIAVDVERDSKRRRQAGGGKHAMEDVLEMKVEQILHQQFGLEPPGNTPAAQRSYIRACFDFKRMMDFGQVELAVGLPQPTVFVTHDRVASYYARLKGLPVLLHKPMGKDTMDADDAEAQTHRNKGIVVFPSALDTYQLTDGEMDAAVRQWTDDLGAPLQRWQPKTALEGATVFKERLLAYTKEWKTDATSLQTHSGMLRWWNVFCLAIAWVKYVYTWSSVAATGSLPPQTNNVQKAFEAWQTWLQKHGRMQRWQWRGDETGPDWAQWSADLEKYTQATAIDLITWLETFAWKDTENEHVWMSMKFLAFQVEDMKTQHTSRGVKNVMPDTMALVYDYIEDGTLYANQALYQAMTWTQNNKELQGLYETTKGIKAALANFTMPKYKVKAVRRKKEQSGGLGQAPVWASFAAAATQKMAGQEMASWMSKTKELHWKSQQMALVSKTTKTLASQPISTHPKTLLHTDSYIQFSRKRWWKHASSPPTLWEHIVGVWRQDESPKTIRMPRHVFYGLNLLLQVYEGAFEQS